MRTTKPGGHEYVSLAHNQRDPETGQSRARILYEFGRKDPLDVAELKRLIASISRFIGPEDVEHLRSEGGLDGMFEFLGAKRRGATHVLDGVRKRLGLQDTFTRLLEERSFRTPVEAWTAFYGDDERVRSCVTAETIDRADARIVMAERPAVPGRVAIADMRPWVTAACRHARLGGRGGNPEGT